MASRPAQVRKTRCRVSVACQTTAKPVVVLIGGCHERLSALSEIRRLVAENQQAQPTALSMLVPERQLGLVIGKAGAHIDDIMAKTNARLSLGRDAYPEANIPSHVPRDGQQKELTITGDFDAVQGAVELVLAKLDEHFPSELLASSRGGPAATGGSPLAAQPASLYTATRDSATPLLDVLSARQRAAHHPAGGGLLRDAGASTAVASPPPVALHAAAVHPRLVGLSQRDHHLPRVEAWPNLMVSIPKREVGGYIGKDGAHVRELERLSGARISIESSKGEADKASTVTFRGTLDENVRAYQLTVQLLAELHQASAAAATVALAAKDPRMRHARAGALPERAGGGGGGGP